MTPYGPQGYPTEVMATIQSGRNVTVMIPWNAPRAAISRGLERLEENSRCFFAGFYVVEESPHAPFCLTFCQDAHGEEPSAPPRADGRTVTIASGARCHDIVEALKALDSRNRYLGDHYPVEVSSGAAVVLVFQETLAVDGLATLVGSEKTL